METNSTEIIEATEEVIDSGEQTEVVEQSTSHNSDFDMVGDDDQAEAVDQQEGKAEEEPPVPKQSRADNHAAKQARLKAERDARISAEAEFDKRIRESGAINPYTDKPFESLKEFEEYGKKVKDAELKERAESEGKTIEELEEEEEARKALQEKRERESKELAEQKEAQAQSNFFVNDLEDFMEKFPTVNVAQLDADDNFHRFCGSRYGREPLADLYADYRTFVMANTPKKEDTRASRSTGAGNSGGAVLTTEQRKSLDEWNRLNPDMRMTPQEYLNR